jgi:molecular chaperone IbpA
MNDLIKRHEKDWGFPDISRYFLGENPFSQLFDHYSPNLDYKYPVYNIICNQDEGYRIEVALPGWDAKDLDISIRKQVLTITGTKKQTLADEGETYHYKGISGKTFTRIFTLGNGLKVTDATLDKGLLCIYLEKEEKENDDTINIDIS